MINDYEATTPMAPETDTSRSQTASNDDTISKLNGLIEICKDGQNGFKDAAEGIENSELKTIFYEFSQQRSEFVGTLQELVRSLGGDPEQSGTLSGAIHRGWIDLKSAITGKNEEAILNECERGEDYAKEAYQDAAKFNFSANIRDVVAEQSQKVVQAHDRIKQLRNSGRQRSSAG